MTASEIFGVPVQGHAGRNAPPRQGDQFRHRLWHFRLRPGQPAGHRAEARPATTSRNISRASPASATTWKTTKQFARTHGFVETLFGRRIHIREINSKVPGFRGGAERAAINAPIQGAAADIIRRAMVRMPDALAEAKLNATMLLQVHDELIFEAPDKEVAKALQADRPGDGEGGAAGGGDFSVPLVVEARAADNWDAAH